MPQSSTFDAVVLAAGKGTRLKSRRPKVLHQLFDKALIERVLLSLEALGVQQAYVVVGHGKGEVSEALSKMNLSTSVETVTQEPQLGTGHAVQVVAQQVGAMAEHVLILSGDVPLIRQSTLTKFVEQHCSSDNDLTLMTAVLETPKGYGRIVMDGDNVKAIVEEKDCSSEEAAIDRVNAGLYCLKWKTISPLLEALSSDNAQGEYYLTDLVSLGVDKGLKIGVDQLEDPLEMNGINTQTDLSASYDILNQRTLETLMSNGVTIINPAGTMIAPEVSIGADTTVYPGCYLSGDITIGEGCAIGPNTTMTGTVKIGNNVTVEHSVVKDSTIADNVNIGPFAHLRNGAEISENVRIGNFVEVKNSNIGAHSNAAHLCYLGDVTMGSDVNMGAGSIIANYDPIRDVKHRTDIQDGVKVGCNSVLVAPVTIERGACVAAGSVITKKVSQDSLAIARGRQAELKGWVSKTKGKSN